MLYNFEASKEIDHFPPFYRVLAIMAYGGMDELSVLAGRHATINSNIIRINQQNKREESFGPSSIYLSFSFYLYF